MSARNPLRRTAVLLGVVAVVVVGGYAASRSMWFRGLFARDTENPGEMDRLRRAALQGAPVAAADTGWPQWLGPTRDARAPAGPLRTDWEANPPKALWTAPCGAGYSSFAVANGRVYTQDKKAGKERVLCLDAATGQELWKHEYAAGQAGADATYGAGPRATPLVDGNRVYTVGGAGKFLCLEAPASAGGKPAVAWEHDLLSEFDAKIPQWGVACSPLLDGDQVIVQPGGSMGTVAAFDKVTGTRRWAFGSNPPGYSSPVAATLHGVRLIFAFTGDALLCLRSDGVLMGSFGWKTANRGNIATPLVIGEYVFITSGYNMGCAALRVVPGGESVSLEVVYARRSKPLRAHHSTPVFKDGYLYGFDDIRGDLKCFNFTTGQLADGWDAAGVDKGTMILADTHLVILTERGDLLLAEARPDEFVPAAKVPKVLNGRNTWALPVLVNGRLYLRDDEKIVCLDVK
jgi:outer membrane protein assembly factor BamB